MNENQDLTDILVDAAKKIVDVLIDEWLKD